MFGIGTGELLLLALIALLVLGPERMPKLMRDVGKTMGDLRQTSDQLREELLNADQKVDPTKVLDVASRIAPAEGKAAEMGATMGGEHTPPSPEAEETPFDREARLARERLEREEE